MGHRVRSRRRAATSARILAAGMALCSLVSLRPVRAAPGDIFTVSAPAVTDTPARAASITPESAAVSTKTGALTYSYPIKVPPGRVQPTLSLDYSSQAPIYGTLANGFSKFVPDDWSQDEIAKTAEEVAASIANREAQQRSFGENSSSGPGHRRRLNEEHRFLRQLKKALNEE